MPTVEEDDFLLAARNLATSEKVLAEEYLLLMASGSFQTWQAQKMAEVKHGRAVRLHQAEYEIALARLRRA